MNLSTAKKAMTGMLKAKKMDAKISKEIEDFLVASKKTLYDVIPKNLVETAIELKVVNPKIEKVDSKIEKVEAKVEKAQEIKKELEKITAEYAKMQAIVKKISKPLQETLFRLTWKDGRTYQGMDVFAAYKVTERGNLHLVGRELTYDKDDESFLVQDSLFELDATILACESGKILIYDTVGVPRKTTLTLPEKTTKERRRTVSKDKQKVEAKVVKVQEKIEEGKKGE